MVRIFRRSKNNPIRSLTRWNPVEKRRRDTLKANRKDQVERDITIMKIGDWIILINDRKE